MGDIAVHSTGNAPLPPNATPLTADDPAKIGNYPIIARLPSSSGLTSYLARTSNMELVVLKLSVAQPAGGNRIRRNFADAASAKMPFRYVARVVGKGMHNGLVFLVREYVEGMPLSQLVAEDGVLDQATLNAVAVSTIAAIAAVHDTDEVHGNLKPTNVLVCLAGVRLLDHCLARQSGQPRPEGSDDVRAWARIVAFAATGRLLESPAADSSFDVTTLDKPIGALVGRALCFDRDQRPLARDILLGLVNPVDATRASRRWRRH